MTNNDKQIHRSKTSQELAFVLYGSKDFCKEISVIEGKTSLNFAR